MKKISFITTVNHNVGDDFVREGLVFLLRRFLQGEELVFENIHKHAPVTVRKGFENIRYYPLAFFADLFLPLCRKRDHVLSADILIQSGAPVYWCHPGHTHCADNEWYRPLIKRRFNKVKHKSIFLNMAAGTCQRYNSNGSEFMTCEKDMKYIREIYNFSSLTTVRDKLAKKVLNDLGIDCPLIPCSSIFAVDNNNLHASEPEYVSLNFMNKAGHYTFGQDYNPEQWFKTFREFYYNIKNSDRFVFVCHNKEEVADAKNIDPKAEIFFSNNYKEYLKFYSKAKFGIMNRVHGAFIIGSYGRPSFIIGSDTRARMPEEIGLQHDFVGSVDVNRLMNEYETLKNDISYKNTFMEIKEKAYADYMKAFESITHLLKK